MTSDGEFFRSEMNGQIHDISFDKVSGLFESHFLFIDTYLLCLSKLEHLNSLD